MPPPPVDPRTCLPSRAEPEQRQRRKRLEKENSVGLTEVAVLGLIGLTLAWDIEKQVRRHEEKKDKAETEAEQRRRRRYDWEHGGGGTGRGDGGSHGGGSNSNEAAMRRRSVDHHRAGRIDRDTDRYHRSGRTPRYDDPRENRPYNDPRDDHRYAGPRVDNPGRLDATERRGRSRRDSW